MSFPRAKIQRFNETPSCSPAPGTYDPKLDTKVKTPTIKKDTKQTSEGDLIHGANKPAVVLPIFRTPQLPRKAIKNMGKCPSRERAESSSSVDDLFRGREGYSSSDLCELDGLKQRLKDTVEELSKSKELCELLNVNITEKMNLIEELQCKNELLAVEIENLQTLLDEAHSKHQQSLTMFEAIDRDSLVNIQEIHSMVDALIDKKEIGFKEMSSLQEELDNLASLKLDLEQKVTQKQQMILLLQSELSNAEVELVECKSECERMNATASERNLLVEALNATIGDLEHKMEETDKQLRHMRDNLMNGSVVRENLEEQLIEKETAYMALQESFSKLSTDCECLKEQHSKDVEQIISACDKQLSDMVNNLELASEIVRTNTSNLQEVCGEKLLSLKNKVDSAISLAQKNWQKEIIHLKGDLKIATFQLKEEQLKAHEKITSLVSEIQRKDMEALKRIRDVESEARIITEKLLRAEEELRMVTDIKDELKISDVENKITIVELQDKIDLLTVERNSVDMALAAITEECSTLKSQNKKLIVGNRNINDSLEALRVRLLESESDVEEMATLKCTLESDKRLLEVALKSKLLELEEQRASIAKMEADNLQQIEEVREHLLEELESFKQKALESSAELKKSEDDKHAQIQTLSCHLENFRQEFQELNRYIAAMEDANEKQTRQLEAQLEESVTSLNSRFELQSAELKQRTNDLTGQIANQEKQIVEYKCQIEQLTTDIDNSETRILELNEALNVMEESNAEHEREIEALTEKLDHQCDCAKVATQQIAHLEATRSYQEHQIQTLSSELERHKEFSHHATERVLTLVNSNTEKDLHIEALNEEIEELKNCSKKVKDESEKLKTELSSEQRKLKESTEEIKLLEGDRFVKEEQLQELTIELDQQRKCNHKFSQQVAALEGQKQEIEDELKSVKIKLVELDRIPQLEETLSLQEYDKTFLRQICEKNQKQIEALRAEITKLTLKLNAEQNEAQSTIVNLKKELENYEEKLTLFDVLEEESADWQRRYHELECLVGPFKEQLEAYRSECKVLEAQKGEVQEELHELALQYGANLGHQNQKQKIRHVQKIMDQNYHLKEEVRNLRRMVEKLQKSGAANCSKTPNVNHTFLVGKGKENVGQNNSPVRKSPAASPNSTPFADRTTHKNVM